MKYHIFLILSSLFLGSQLYGQTALGEWQEHLPYYLGKHIAESPDKIYCATDMGLFYVFRSNQSHEKITRIDGLSDVGVNTIEYNEETDILLVAYTNSNIDLLKGNRIFNIPDIKNKIMSGNKSINSILFINKTAYLACGFGIVLVDLDKFEIKDTYYIGDHGGNLNVYDLAFDGLSIYAATENGLYYGDINNDFLADYSNWNHIDNAPHANATYASLTFFDNKLYSLFKNEEELAFDTIFVFDYTNWSVFENDYEQDYISLHTDYDNLVVIRQSGVRFYESGDVEVRWMHTYPWANGSFNHGIKDSDDVYWYADNNYGLIRSLFIYSASAIALAWEAADASIPSLSMTSMKVKSI